MIVIDVNLLVELGAERPGPCVSLFVPAPPSGPDAAQVPVHVSNMVREVTRRLTASGMREGDARRLIQPAERLAKDPSAIQGRGRGLAIFASPGTLESARVPTELGPSFVIATRFVTRPLLGAIRQQSTYHVLALSQGAVRLLKVAGPDVKRVDVPGMPAGISDILKYQEMEAPTLEHHSTGRHRRGDAPATFHGTTELSDAQKAAVNDLLRAVDTAIKPIVDANSMPLVVAAVDYLDATFRDVTSCRSIIPERVTGSPDRLSARELAEKARRSVDDYWSGRTHDAIARFEEIATGPRTSMIIDEVIRAAGQGRVEELFVATDAELWGVFEQADGKVRQLPAMGPEADDLLDLAAIKALASGANVYPLPLSEMPGPGPARPLAAVFRWG
jgi:hypothetical protein